jgi:hypothetical protein
MVARDDGKASSARRRLLARRGRGRLTCLVVLYSPIALGNVDQVVVLDGARAAGRPTLSRSP